MPNPRKNQISLASTPYYHCIGRCVRRAYLWGWDEVSKRDYSHRKAWVVERLTQLANVFAIDICAYAIMANHYHLVLHINVEKANSWSYEEVARRWGSIFSLPLLAQKLAKNELNDSYDASIAKEVIEQLRQRLCDLSWFMRSLNEPIARRANHEDECKGRFWEGRFKSQAILDEAGLLACCAYVDLNPVRAGIVNTPEESDFTAIQQRLQAYVECADRDKTAPAANLTNRPAKSLPPLHPFAGHADADHNKGLPYSLQDYLELLDWSARAIRPDKPGHTHRDTPPILARLGFDANDFTHSLQAHGMTRGTVIGRLEQMKTFAHALHRRYVVGVQIPEPHVAA